jgi:hypothetical protein
MSVAPALSAPEIAALVGPSVPAWFAVHDDAGGAPVGTARITSTPTYPLSTLPITGQSGGWGNIKPDQVVFVGSSAGGCDRGIYRPRWQAFGADYPNLQIEQIGASDSGELAIAVRNTSIQVNDYVTVLDRFDLLSKDPRIVYSGLGVDATIYEDYDRGVYTENKYPPPFVNVFIAGTPAHYATHVYAGTTKTFDIVMQPYSWWGAGMTYAIVVPGSWTVNSGSLTGSVGNGALITINVTAPHSTSTYTVQFIVTDPTGTGSQFTAIRKVWIKSNVYPPISLVSIDSRVNDTTGTRWSVTLNQLVGAPVAAMWHFFDMGTWGGSDVPTADKCFTGWVTGRREITGIGVANVQLELSGPSYILGLISGRSQIMTAVNALPLSYQELWYQHSYLAFVLWWILYQRVSGMLRLFNITFPPIDTGTYRYMTDWRIDTGSILSQLQTQARRYQGGNFGCDPTGEIMIRRHVSRVPWSERGAIPVRASFTASMYKEASLGFEQRPQVRQLRSEAFYSDGLTFDTPYWSDAPVVAGEGQRDEKLEKMIVASESELWELTGNEFQARNNPYPNGTLQIPKNWAVLYPAQMTRISLDIAPALRYDNIQYTGYILPKQVLYTHNPDGTVDMAVEFEAETVGVPGVHVDIPLADPTTTNSPYQYTPFAPIPPWRRPNPNPAGTPAGPAVIPKDGSTGFSATSTKAYVVSNIFGTPKYRDITPTGIL